MKKLLAICICASMTAALSGCSPGNILEKFTSTGDLAVESPDSAQAPAEVKERVYMDEITGTLEDFTGSTLSLSADETSYIFDVSQASLECKAGMITGDEISIIYEGQLQSTDTSMVKALKVVDDFHKKSKLKTTKVYGIIQKLTPNTITIKSDKGDTATYPITGTPQYYQSGLKKGNWVYLKFRGKYPDAQDKNSAVLNASHLKVLSISDLEDFKVKSDISMPSADPSSTENIKEFQAEIQDVKDNILQIIVNGKSSVQNLDLSVIPAYFSGGIAPGSHVTVTYTGELKDDTLAGITVLAVTGDNPKKLNQRHMSFTATGSVLGTTANTVTIKTTDGAIDIFRTDNASDISTGGLIEGASIKITFDPSQSATSNIYEALKITDA